MAVAGNRRRRGLLALVAVAGVVAGAGCGAWVLRPDDVDGRETALPSSGCRLVVQVFLDRNVEPSARDGVEFVIRHLPQVHSYNYQDRDGSLIEAERVLADHPESLERARRDPSILPPSFRIVPTTGNPGEITALTAALADVTGVTEVSWEMDGVDHPGHTSWTDQPEIVVFLEQDVSEEERSAVEQAIVVDPGVATTRYLDQAETMAEFVRLFASNQEMLDRVRESPDLLPASFRITPTTADNGEIEATSARLADIPDVLRARSAAETMAQVERQLATLGCG